MDCWPVTLRLTVGSDPWSLKDFQIFVSCSIACVGVYIKLFVSMCVISLYSNRVLFRDEPRPSMLLTRMSPKMIVPDLGEQRISSISNYQMSMRHRCVEV